MSDGLQDLKKWCKEWGNRPTSFQESKINSSNNVQMFKCKKNNNKTIMVKKDQLKKHIRHQLHFFFKTCWLPLKKISSRSKTFKRRHRWRSSAPWRSRSNPPSCWDPRRPGTWPAVQHLWPNLEPIAWKHSCSQFDLIGSWTKRTNKFV